MDRPSTNLPAEVIARVKRSIATPDLGLTDRETLALRRIHWRILRRIRPEISGTSGKVIPVNQIIFQMGIRPKHSARVL